MKRAWRPLLDEFKIVNSRLSTLSKDAFPSLLMDLMDKLGSRADKNMIAGFKATGIWPFNHQQVLKRLPQSSTAEVVMDSPVGEALLDHLQSLRAKEAPTTRRKRRRLNVQAGKSISAADFEPRQDQENSDEENEDPQDPLEQEETAITVDTWVLVAIRDGRRTKYVPGKVLSVQSDSEYLVGLLRPKAGSPRDFMWPQEEEHSSVHIDNVERRLQPPTAGRRGALHFLEDLPS